MLEMFYLTFVDDCAKIVELCRRYLMFGFKLSHDTVNMITNLFCSFDFL